ncbi:MAG: crotonobetainyl-CoA:carnitine CoA-transferase CaiB-like acyl-CoA transferase, partial [Gammaproteobacteria bacterium]
HFNARDLFETVEINGQPLKIPAILPKLDKTPGATRWPGPTLGSHNAQVLGDILGLTSDELTHLSNEGVI